MPPRRYQYCTSPSGSRTVAVTPVSSRTSRTAVSAPLSPGFCPPFGSPVTRRLPAGVITSSSLPRTTTPPYEVSSSVDIALQRVWLVDGQPPAALGDDAGALEHREETAGRLARGAGQLGEVGLGGDDGHVALAGALGARLVDELREDGGGAALVVEHRQLAEDVSGTERGERDLAAVRVLAQRAGMAGVHDVAGIR